MRQHLAAILALAILAACFALVWYGKADPWLMVAGSGMATLVAFSLTSMTKDSHNDIDTKSA